MRTVRLDHLHYQVIVLTIDVQEKFFFLEGLWVVVGSGRSPTTLIIVRMGTTARLLYLVMRPT